MGVKVEVWGDYACFSRPEMKVERVSYDVMTPSAARGILEAIYWHPGLKWTVQRIHVLNEIRFTNIRRNEVKSKISGRNVWQAMKGSGKDLYLATPEEIQQRAATVLQDVHYVIEARFDLTDKAAPSDNDGKFRDIIRRRLEKGQNFQNPYFGNREFPVHFCAYEGEEDPKGVYSNSGEQDLGYMLYDMDYSDPNDIRPVFFRAVLKNGILDLKDCGVVR